MISTHKYYELEKKQELFSNHTMNWGRNKKSFFSLSWLLKLKKNINGSSNLTKNQESDQAQNSKKPESFPREIDSNRQKWKGCKMKATKIEDMKKGKMNEDIEGECSRVFDRFAVVKSSVDPQKDFRDSMVEMITENGILRPRELEELLACYLTLNHDEYHDLIVQVFRDIWLELLEIRASSRIALEDL